MKSPTMYIVYITILVIILTIILILPIDPGCCHKSACSMSIPESITATTIVFVGGFQKLSVCFFMEIPLNLRRDCRNTSHSVLQLDLK
ncbi:MAG: hypothetical protein IPP49_09525 [Saprospiraceae bacterium]|nr:hypothetical protein [Saprospiraceae bacterium]